MPMETPPQEPEVTKTSADINADMPDVFATEATQQTPPTETTTPPTPAPEVADATPGTPAAEPQVSPVIQRLRELGFQDVKDEQDGLSRALDAFQQSRETQQILEGRISQLQQQATLMQSQLAQQLQTGRQAPADLTQPGAVPTPAPSEPADPWPEIPNMDMATYQSIQKFRTPDGGWAPNTPPSLVAKYSQWETAVSDWQTRLVMDPKGALQPIIDHEVQKAVKAALGGDPNQLIDQRLETRSKEEIRQAEATKAWERAYPWMWQADPVTNQPSSRPTEFGQRFQQSFQQASERIKSINPTIDEDSLFITALEEASWRHADELQYLEQQWQAYQQAQQGQPPSPVAPAAAAPPAAPPPPQVDPREKARQDFLDKNRKANAGGQRGGALPEDGQGRKRRPNAQGANAIGAEFVNSLAGDGFFSGA